MDILLLNNKQLLSLDFGVTEDLLKVAIKHPDIEIRVIVKHHISVIHLAPPYSL